MAPKKKSKKKKRATTTITTTSSSSPSPPQENLILIPPETLTESSESTAAASVSTFSASTSFASSYSSSASAAESSSSAAAGDDGDGDERRDLAWLIDAFADASIGKIESAYRLAGGDAFLAASILVSDPQPPDPPPDTMTTPSPLPRRACGGRKQKRAVVASGMVADCIGREYSRPVPVGGGKERDWDVEWYRAEEGKLERKGSGICNGLVEGKLEEQKYVGEEAEQFLCSMLGESSELGMGIVKDVLGQCGGDLEKALDALLDISDPISLSDMDNKLGIDQTNDICYQNFFPGNGVSNKFSPRESKAFPFQLTDRPSIMSCHVSESELLWEYDSRAYSEDFSNLEVQQSPSKPEAEQKVLESLFNIPEVRTHDPSTMDWKKVVKKLKPPRQQPQPSSPNMQASKGKSRTGRVDGYHEFRDASTMHYDTMKSYYQKAALAYSRGDRAYASYLAEEAKQYRQLGRKADEKASQEIFQARNKVIKNVISIDLHGQHVKPALRILKDNLLYCVKLPSVLLRVITGCGTDGPGKGKIKRAVMELVQREGIPYAEENSGTIALRLCGPREFLFSENGSDPE